MDDTPAGLLAIMGSGELTKSMLPVHRRLLERAGRHTNAVFLDTPAAFQSNVEDLAKQAAAFFQSSLQVHLATPASTDLDDPSYLRLLANADLIFSGPGSPSYALRRWAGTRIPDLLLRTLAKGGSVAFASAAAITLGPLAIPVYEIFKSGEDPFWLPGLGILPRLGLDFAVVPHFDNGTGKDFDTRFCYLGERRFNELLTLLPAGTGILGIDEHTACLIDCAALSVRAIGRGRVIFDTGSERTVLRSGQKVELETIGGRPTSWRPSAPAPAREPVSGDQMSRLIQGVVDLRSKARSDADWELADRLRELLEEAGVTVQDRSDGTGWALEP